MKENRLRTLFICGILSSSLYIVLNIVTVMLYDGYDWISQTVSELSAIDTPTRSLWLVFVMFYELLILAFAYGVRQSAGKNKKQRIAGTILLIYAIIGFFWPPMHQRTVIANGGGSFTDTMHLAFAFVTVPLMLSSMLVGAFAFGKKFRIYTLLSVVVLLFFGILTGIDGPKISENRPTPYIGIWERINIGVFMIWIVVLAMILLRKNYLAQGTSPRSYGEH
jgi:hypothetical protein